MLMHPAPAIIDITNVIMRVDRRVTNVRVRARSLKPPSTYSDKKIDGKKHMSILKYGKIGSLFSDFSHFCNAYLIILLPTRPDLLKLLGVGSLEWSFSEHLKKRWVISQLLFSLPSFKVFLKSNHYLGGGFKYFLCLPLFGEDSHFDKYFSDGLKPPTSYSLIMVTQVIIIHNMISLFCWSKTTRCLVRIQDIVFLSILPLASQGWWLFHAKASFETRMSLNPSVASVKPFNST